MFVVNMVGTGAAEWVVRGKVFKMSLQGKKSISTRRADSVTENTHTWLCNPTYPRPRLMKYSDKNSSACKDA